MESVASIEVKVTSNIGEYKELLDELVIAASKVDELIQKINATELELKVA